MKIKKITNLVFEGGGILGLAYAGVIKALEEAKLLKGIREVAGTSVGSIAAAAVALGCDSKFADKWIKEFNAAGIIDGSKYKLKILYDVNTKLGWCPGAALENWVEEMLDELFIAANVGKGGKVTRGRDLTFSDVYRIFGRKLYITGTSISSKTVKYFCEETTPDMLIKTAIRASAAVPFIFTPVSYCGELYVDGGWLNNYPINIFDSENGCQTSDETLGFMLVNGGELQSLNKKMDENNNSSVLKFGDDKGGNDVKNKIEIDNIFEFSAALIETLFKGGQEAFLEKNDLKNTVFIEVPHGLSSLNFNISDMNRAALYDVGFITTKRFISRFI